jgi:hypothetical protein
MTLEEIYQFNRVGDFPDKGTTHSYIEVYEKLFEGHRFGFHNVLEIGILGGASLKMWEQYFQASKVYGVDCEEKPVGGKFNLTPMIESGKHLIKIMDATDEKAIKKAFKGIKFDVVIDDASHILEHQIKTYNALKPFLNPNAIYVIEDVQDIDKDRWVFESMGAEIIDRRHVKGRYDDVLIIIKN